MSECCSLLGEPKGNSLLNDEFVLQQDSWKEKKENKKILKYNCLRIKESLT